MAILFENFKLNESSGWKNGELCLVSIENKDLYFVTDKNRPAHRKFSRLDAIIKLSSIDKRNSSQWIGDIVWLGDIMMNNPSDQILGVKIPVAMKSRKIDRLIVHTNEMIKNDDLAKQIISANTSSFKRDTFIPIEAQHYAPNGAEIKKTTEQYKSTSVPISIKASVIMGQPATYAEDKKAIILTTAFEGDRTNTLMGSYVRMLNQHGYTIEADGNGGFDQNYSYVHYPLAFPNHHLADQFKAWFKEKIKEFPGIERNMVDDFESASGKSNNIIRDPDGFFTNMRSIDRTPLDIKRMAEEVVGEEEINDEDKMGGEHAITNLFEGKLIVI